MCYECAGTGVILESPFYEFSYINCYECDGAGEIEDNEATAETGDDGA